ncbi:MAG: hypothetical protein OZSIB_1012 [Candidatus Ozemobacter sibiricus]|jgi:hypothetical protein|uniref:Lysine-specific metallo-endopeptidase domain-containing protein n=1 Tax=Candidatus Ozemobacter sibiricus TaxID=2268124 RepID=A0A367ZNB1_9BACT|nr:MAG: hypothetical protein OZSIB_1012 [Candidatus Ozemobacter sibiricus]
MSRYRLLTSLLVLAMMVLSGPAALRAEEDIIPSDQEVVGEDDGGGAVTGTDTGSDATSDTFPTDDQDTSEVSETDPTDPGSDSSAGSPPDVGRIIDTIRNVFSKVWNFISQLLNLFGINIGTIGGPGITSGPGSTGGTSTGRTPGSTSDGTSTGSTGDGSAEGLAGEIRSQFGITLRNGPNEDIGAGFSCSAGQWSASELRLMRDVLARLPAGFRRCTTVIQSNGRIQGPQFECAGLYDPATGLMRISKTCLADGSFRGTLVHEMTHAFQRSNPTIEQQWTRLFWAGNRPRTSSISDYGNTNPAEDMAECVRVYFEDSATLRAQDPARYNFIKQFIMSGQEY